MRRRSVVADRLRDIEVLRSERPEFADRRQGRGCTGQVMLLHETNVEGDTLPLVAGLKPLDHALVVRRPDCARMFHRRFRFPAVVVRLGALSRNARRERFLHQRQELDSTIQASECAPVISVRDLQRRQEHRDRTALDLAARDVEPAKRLVVSPQRDQCPAFRQRRLRRSGTDGESLSRRLEGRRVFVLSLQQVGTNDVGPRPVGGQLLRPRQAILGRCEVPHRDEGLRLANQRIRADLVRRTVRNLVAGLEFPGVPRPARAGDRMTGVDARRGVVGRATPCAQVDRPTESRRAELNRETPRQQPGLDASPVLQTSMRFHRSVGLEVQAPSVELRRTFEFLWRDRQDGTRAMGYLPKERIAACSSSKHANTFSSFDCASSPYTCFLGRNIFRAAPAIITAFFEASSSPSIALSTKATFSMLSRMFLCPDGDETLDLGRERGSPGLLAELLRQVENRDVGHGPDPGFHPSPPTG